MTKDDFFNLCRASDPEFSLAVDWGIEERGLERTVLLRGSWLDSSLVSRELYRPTPGRQGRDYAAANLAVDRAGAKFQRWLEEFEAYWDDRPKSSGARP